MIEARSSAWDAHNTVGSVCRNLNDFGKRRRDDGEYCGRRVATLYLVPGSKYFGCRQCHDFSYESRNEPRLARPGGIGYPIKAERLYEELYVKTKRWTWRGRPTRKARKLRILERKMAGVAEAYNLLLKR